MRKVNGHEFGTKAAGHVYNGLYATMTKLFVPQVKIWWTRGIMSGGGRG